MSAVLKIGRPTLCTPELTELVCKFIRRGQRPKEAAGNAGVPGSTFTDWMRWGRNGQEPYSDFSFAVKQAENECRGFLTGIMLAAAESDPKHWKAAQALLDRIDNAGAYASPERRASSLKPLPGNLTAAEFWQRFEVDLNERMAILAEHKRSLVSLGSDGAPSSAAAALALPAAAGGSLAGD